MNKSFLRGISLVLSVALILSVFPLTAFAERDNKDIHHDVSLEESSGPSVSQEPESSTSPEPSPTTEPSVEPSPSVEPEPSESPEPSPSSQTDIQDNLIGMNLTLESLIDEDGYLTDEGLLSLSSLPSDPDKFIENVDNGNGTKSLKLYSSPIKFKDKDGKYKNIDNSIIETKGTYKYKNKASDIQVGFSDDLNQSSAISIDYLGYKIGFRPLNILLNMNKSTAQISFKDNAKKEDYIFDNNKTYDSINYSKAFNNKSDIEITPVSNGVKEDIILYEIPEKNEFSYELTVSDVVPVLRRDGNLYFIDLNKNAKVAAIAPPVMHDSTVEWEYSEDIAVELIKTGENTYIYTLTPDKSYLENAVYPVIIDPTVTTLDEAVGDTHVKSGYSGDYHNYTDIIVGTNASGTKYRGYIKILQTELTRLRGLLGNVSIDKVIFHTYEAYSGASSPTIELHPITPPDGEIWNLDTITWANQPNYASNYLCAQTVQSVKWYTWDVTKLGQDWFYNTTTRYGDYTYGFMLKIANENLNQYKTFNSQQNSSNPNYFEFVYTDTVPPNQPLSFTTPNMSFSTSTGSVTIGCSKVADKPAAPYCIGVKEYWFERSLDNGATWGDRKVITYNGADFQYATFTGIPDNLVNKLRFRVCAVDKNYPSLNPNTSEWKISGPYSTPDKTGPVVPQNLVYTTPDARTNYTNVTSPTLYWSGVTDEGNHLQRIEAVVDNTNGTWQNMGSAASGSHSISVTGDGVHTIYIRGVDTSGNVSTTYATITYKLDTTPPIITLSVPEGNLKGIVAVKATITNSGQRF